MTTLHSFMFFGFEFLDCATMTGANEVRPMGNGSSAQFGASVRDEGDDNEDDDVFTRCY